MTPNEGRILHFYPLRFSKYGTNYGVLGIQQEVGKHDLNEYTAITLFFTNM